VPIHTLAGVPPPKSSSHKDSNLDSVSRGFVAEADLKRKEKEKAMKAKQSTVVEVEEPRDDFEGFGSITAMA